MAQLIFHMIVSIELGRGTAARAARDYRASSEYLNLLNNFWN